MIVHCPTWYHLFTSIFRSDRPEITRPFMSCVVMDKPEDHEVMVVPVSKLVAPVSTLAILMSKCLSFVGSSVSRLDHYSVLSLGCYSALSLGGSSVWMVPGLISVSSLLWVQNCNCFQTCVKCGRRKHYLVALSCTEHKFHSTVLPASSTAPAFGSRTRSSDHQTHSLQH